jgi:hypothetical protein
MHLLKRLSPTSMLDNGDLTLGLAVITGRARSAAKALSIVAQDITRSRLPGEDPKMLSLRLEEDQFHAFQYLVDNVLNLSREAAEIVEVLARGAKGDAETTTRGGTKAARKTEDEDYLPKQR